MILVIPATNGCSGECASTARHHRSFNMKRLIFAAALAATTLAALATDIAVSINIGQPDFYGRLVEVDGYPPPQLIYQRPRIMYRSAINRPPIYMHVPPGHARDWRKHCRLYNACGEAVYFVRSDWYNNQYVPHYQKKHSDRRDDRGDDRRDGQRDDRRDKQDNRGQGRGY
jgi:hypothetical protein